MAQITRTPEKPFLASFYGKGKISVCRHEYPVSAPGLQGIKIAFVTDVHACRMFPHEAVARLVDTLNAIAPDLLLLGGDYAENRLEQIAFFDALKAVTPPLGIYGVAGNNDEELIQANALSLKDVMARCGGVFLRNKTRAIIKDGAVLLVGGVDEMKYGRPSTTLFKDKMHADLTILISHYPHALNAFAALPESRQPDIALAGHTHGGQFRFGSFTPYSIYFEHHLGKCPVFGKHTMGKMTVIVSNGLGMSRLPMRIGAQPEVHVITLTAPRE